MRSLADEIEAHIRQLVRASGGLIEVKRQELAIQFSCVPSQINYVLATRFTEDRGYLVVSRRGGAGHLRIKLLPLMIRETLAEIARHGRLSQDEASLWITRLHHGGYLSQRETSMLLMAMQRDILQLELPLRDDLRARLFIGMLRALLAEEE